MRFRLHVLAVALLCMALVVPAWADITLCDSGPVNGTITGWNISPGFEVSNSIFLSGPSTLNGLTFYSWMTHGDTALSVNWVISQFALGFSPLASGTATPTQSFLFFNGTFSGYDIDSETISLPDVSLPAGSYWLTLESAITSSGNPMYWDQNNGLSLANEQIGPLTGNCLANINLATFPAATQDPGTCGSEAFFITGTQAVSEPSSLLLLGPSLVGVLGAVRRRLLA